MVKKNMFWFVNEGHGLQKGLAWAKPCKTANICLKTISLMVIWYDLMSGFSGWLSVSLLDLDFVCGSSWKQLARWQGMKELPGSSLMLPSRRPADSLHGPPSPALPGGLRPAQGQLCDVGCPIKANASWIPRPNFPLSLYLSQRWLRVRAARELGFTQLTQTVSLFASSWLWQNHGWKELKQLEECVWVSISAFSIQIERGWSKEWILISQNNSSIS